MSLVEINAATARALGEYIASSPTLLQTNYSHLSKVFVIEEWVLEL